MIKIVIVSIDELFLFTLNNDLKSLLLKFIEIDNIKPVIFVLDTMKNIFEKLKPKSNILTLNKNLNNLVNKYIKRSISIYKLSKDDTNNGMMGGFMKQIELIIQFGIQSNVLDINKITEKDYNNQIMKVLI
jgi:hypothetical protein